MLNEFEKKLKSIENTKESDKKINYKKRLKDIDVSFEPINKKIKNKKSKYYTALNNNLSFVLSKLEIYSMIEDFVEFNKDGKSSKEKFILDLIKLVIKIKEKEEIINLGLSSKDLDFIYFQLINEYIFNKKYDIIIKKTFDSLYLKKEMFLLKGNSNKIVIEDLFKSYKLENLMTYFYLKKIIYFSSFNNKQVKKIKIPFDEGLYDLIDKNLLEKRKLKSEINKNPFIGLKQVVFYNIYNIINKEKIFGIQEYTKIFNDILNLVMSVDKKLNKKEFLEIKELLGFYLIYFKSKLMFNKLDYIDYLKKEDKEELLKNINRFKENEYYKSSISAYLDKYDFNFISMLFNDVKITNLLLMKEFFEYDFLEEKINFFIYELLNKESSDINLNIAFNLIENKELKNQIIEEFKKQNMNLIKEKLLIKNSKKNKTCYNNGNLK